MPATNVFSVTQKVLDQVVRLYENNLVLASKVNRQFDSEFARSPGKVGYTLNARLPTRFNIRTGATFSATDLADPVVSIPCNAQKGVDFEISMADATMVTDDIINRYAKPAAETLAAQVDAEGYQLYKKIGNIVGTPGTQPTSSNGASMLMKANARLTDQGAPMNDRHLILSTQHQVSFIDSFKGLFNSQQSLSKQWDSGQFAQGILGYDTISAAQSVAAHAAGNYSGTLQVNLAQGANSGSSYQTGTLDIKGGATSVTGFFKAGDVITIGGCYAVDPITKQAKGYLKEFTITADANTDGSGLASLNIAPAIVYAGPYATVSAQAANNASVSVLTGSANAVSEQSLSFHRDAMTLVMADLELPPAGSGATGARRRMGNTSFRAVTYYDGDNDLLKFRIDGLWAWTAFRPEWACRDAF
jgi:hypothetical protein